MIDAECLHSYIQKFHDYILTFRHSDSAIQENLTLKQMHSVRVRDEISSLAKSIGLKNGELRLAELIGLFHDIGRFEQYVRYRTFADRHSENHADLGVRIIREHNLVKGLDEEFQNIVYKAIQYHNRKNLPEDEDPAVLLYSRLLRDADKIDIFKVVTDYYLADQMEKNQAIELDLPDLPGYSPEIYEDLKNHRIVDNRHLRTLNDFKLLQMGWVFDINFPKAYEKILERNYLHKMRKVLPADPLLDQLHADLTVYLQNKCIKIELEKVDS